MPKEIRPPERALEKLCAPYKIVVGEDATRRLGELCSTMADTCGLIEAILQLAVEDENKKEKRAAYIKIALDLSARGTIAIKLFLSEWSALVEESKTRQNSAGRFVKDSEGPSLALILDSITAHDLSTDGRLQPLAETERRAIVNALQEAGGNKLAASRVLGIGRTTLYRKLKGYSKYRSGNTPHGIGLSK